MKKSNYILTIICLFFMAAPLISAVHEYIYVRGANGYVEKIYMHHGKTIAELRHEIARRFNINQRGNRIILHDNSRIFSDEEYIASYPDLYDNGLGFTVEPIAPVITDNEVILEEGFPRRRFRGREFFGFRRR